MSVIIEDNSENTTVRLEEIVENTTVIIEDNSENTTVVIQEGDSLSLPINTTFTASSNNVNIGEVVTFTWTSENATKVLLQGVEVPINGSKDITFTESDTVELVAFNSEYEGVKSERIEVLQPEDERITYANRIGEDGGSIVGFDLLEDEINTPVGRKEGKLYAYNEDDYTVIRNGGAWEFTRDGVYREVGIDVPRFDWTNGKQELLVEGQATNYIEESQNPESFNFTNGSSLLQDRTLNSPFGENTASLFSANSGTIINTQFKNDGKIYTFSAYVKGVVGETIRLRCFDYSNPSIYKLHTFSGDWERVSITSTNGVTYFWLVDNRQQGNASQFQATQWQIEEGTKATSPIITNGSIVTRPADIITNSQGQLSSGRYDTV